MNAALLELFSQSPIEGSRSTNHLYPSIPPPPPGVGDLVLDFAKNRQWPTLRLLLDRHRLLVNFSADNTRYTPLLFAADANNLVEVKHLRETYSAATDVVIQRRPRGLRETVWTVASAAARGNDPALLDYLFPRDQLELQLRLLSGDAETVRIHAPELNGSSSLRVGEILRRIAEALGLHPGMVDLVRDGAKIESSELVLDNGRETDLLARLTRRGGNQVGSWAFQKMYYRLCAGLRRALFHC